MKRSGGFISCKKNCDSRKESKNGTIYLFNLPPDSIKRITVGTRMPGECRAKIVQAVRANHNLKHVEIHEAVLDLANFDLRYLPLSAAKRDIMQ